MAQKQRKIIRRDPKGEETPVELIDDMLKDGNAQYRVTGVERLHREDLGGLNRRVFYFEPDPGSEDYEEHKDEVVELVTERVGSQIEQNRIDDMRALSEIITDEQAQHKFSQLLGNDPVRWLSAQSDIVDTLESTHTDEIEGAIMDLTPEAAYLLAEVLGEWREAPDTSLPLERMVSWDLHYKSLYHMSLKRLGKDLGTAQYIPDDVKGAFVVSRGKFFSFTGGNSAITGREIENQETVHELMKWSLPLLKTYDMRMAQTRMEIEEELAEEEMPMERIAQQASENLTQALEYRRRGFRDPHMESVRLLGGKSEDMLLLFEEFTKKIGRIIDEDGISDDVVDAFIRKRNVLAEYNVGEKVTPQQLIAYAGRGQEDESTGSTHQQENDDLATIRDNPEAVSKMLNVYMGE